MSSAAGADPGVAAVRAALAGTLGRDVPGVSVAVVDRDGLRWAAGFGVADLATGRPAAPDTVYPWFSMTKLVTATAVVQLAERGRLELDAPAARYVPWFRPRPARGAPPGAAVTVRHLLSHSSGLPNPIPVGWVHPADGPAPDPSAVARRLLARHARLGAAPGARAAYSNLGYLLLGEVVGAAAGQPYEAYVRDHLLRPLGMTRTDFRYRPDDLLPRAATGYQRRWSPLTPLLRLLLPRGILGPAAGPAGRFVAFRRFYVDGPAYGGLLGTAPDAARFLRLHLAGGTVDGIRFLSPGAVAEMQRLAAHGRPLDVGLGWFRRRADGRRGGAFVEHLGDGGAFANDMRLYADRGLGVVVMGNATSWARPRVVAAAAGAPAG
jgi:CubicO group peptidase (beta-lactamase class C family)